MSFLDILYTLLIGPLQLVFEMIFAMANRISGHPGIAIIALSLIMNVLVLPLYRRADAMQEEARDIELKLHEGVTHIKKSFKGDERMMILQTYYQQNHYKPTDALNGSVSLLLEVPFFIAAYQFLSHLQILQGVSFGPINDLGAPDGLLVLGNISINMLPIVMTTVNVVSSALYLKGFPLKTKIQLYAMALFFLVFLYTSPSGLVFYWTLNNLFSLGKNIIYRLNENYKIKERFKQIKFFKISEVQSGQPNKKVFLLGNAFLTVFIGLLIPSAVLGASPQEFIDMKYFHNPLWYLVSSGCLAAGIFIVWMGVFYWLASDAGKVVFDKIVWILCGIAVVNYMFFGTDLGVLFTNLQFENGLIWEWEEELVNFVIILLVAVAMYIFMAKAQKFVAGIIFTVVIAVACMVGVNCVGIRTAVSGLEEQYSNVKTDEMPYFNLSKNGKNVIVFMLDRAMNQYVPYIFNEKPQLKEQFAGFTYYSNTISFGGSTNFGAPALFGGYEYTPVELNKREQETLESKHNEALKVMPAIFNDNNYEVTVCDPPYAGYQWIPDLSIYDDMSGVKTYITQGKFSDTLVQELEIKNNRRNFFCYGFMKSMPLFLQEIIYDEGRYNQADVVESNLYTAQIRDGNMKSDGLFAPFMSHYNVLINLSEMTKVIEEDKNTFLTITNGTTHEPMLLQEPEYVPSLHVDNTEYMTEYKDRFNVNGREMRVEEVDQMMHYHSNLTSFIQLGKWFDYMRENGVYDNTRIILVADHGRDLGQLEELMFDFDSRVQLDIEAYYPLLMVKDFNSTEFQVSNEFMTNADVPSLAMKDLIVDPVNPYTGKKISDSEKIKEKQYIIVSSVWDTTINNGNTFLPAHWLEFCGDNIWDKESWKYIDEELILPTGVE